MCPPARMSPREHAQWVYSIFKQAAEQSGYPLPKEKPEFPICANCDRPMRTGMVFREQAADGEWIGWHLTCRGQKRVQVARRCLACGLRWTEQEGQLIHIRGSRVLRSDHTPIPLPSPLPAGLEGEMASLLTRLRGMLASGQLQMAQEDDILATALEAALSRAA